MTGHTEEEAWELMCLKSGGSICYASKCMAWRWMPLEADAAFLSAVKSRMKMENHEKTYHHAQASRYVNENRAEFGLPTKPFLGYCGLAGKP